MTHIELDPSWPTEPLGRIDNVLDGVTGSVELWDFSLANSSYEARVHFVSKVASVCYQSPKALGSISLFNRLQAESAGLPSSSYEFVPVWVNPDKLTEIEDGSSIDTLERMSMIKYGELITTAKGEVGLLTNLRALIADVGPEESLNYLNTSEEEQQIIKDNFKVFLFNIDVPTRTQMIRHRVSWQELSRRYVSGKKQSFEFYVSSKLQSRNITIPDPQDSTTTLNFEDLIELSVKMYDEAIANGVKPEEARRILPQAMMTTIWGAFQPNQLDSFFKLRLHKTAQKEVRMVAEAMKKVLDED